LKVKGFLVRNSLFFEGTSSPNIPAFTAEIEQVKRLPLKDDSNPLKILKRPALQTPFWLLLHIILFLLPIFPPGSPPLRPL